MISDDNMGRGQAGADVSIPTPASPSDIKSALKAGQFDVAFDLAEALLAQNPDNEEALYLALVSARYCKAFTRAESHLSRLKHQNPEFGRVYQEQGHLHRAQGRDMAAFNAYRLATRYNPTLLASWRAQIALGQRLAHHSAVSEAKLQLSRFETLPPPLLAIANHVHEGRIFKAEELVRRFLVRHPHHVEAMRLLADIGVRLGVLDDADLLLEAASELDPENIQIQIEHIQVLRKRQKFANALNKAKALYDSVPDNALFQSVYAIESMQAGQYELALDLFDRILEQHPNDTATHTSRGHALKTCGRRPEAEAAYKKALAIDPYHGDAWYGLANLKTYVFSGKEREDMLAALKSADLPFMARVYITFSLGKAFEDNGNYSAAFEHYSYGNALKKKQTRYTTEQMHDEFNAQKTFVTQNTIAHLGEGGNPASDPIFIVGLPRAGSTLIEQILASHSLVDGTLELPNILSLAHGLRGRNLVSDRHHYPRNLAQMTQQTRQELGTRYIDETRIHRGNAPFFTDKMPNNFRHIGLIHTILPNAKIIDARRQPLDCCWSGFKQLFADGQEFTYGLAEIGAYYAGYVDLMTHWDTVLPEGRILCVQHEELLDDFEGQVRRLLDYCKLPFEQACIDFHKTERAVRTASAEQVRTPLNRKGQGQWRPYTAHLETLITALGPHCGQYQDAL